VCRHWIAQLERQHAEVERAGLKILAVGIGEPQHVQRYSQRYAPSIACVCGQGTETHTRYGLQRHTIAELFSRPVVVSHIRAAANGFAPGVITGELKILTGQFIVDTSGIIRYAHYSRHVGDDASVSDILTAFAKI
jgi:hypothetical protein